MRTLSRIRHIRWRVVYGLFFGPLAARVFAWFLRGYASLRSLDAAEGLLSVVERRFVYSGWPYFGYGWTNLHASRFTAMSRRQLHRHVVVNTRRPVRDGAPRIGCIGAFVALLGFPKRVMQACPVPLVIADVKYASRTAEYLRDCAAAYKAFDSGSADVERSLAEFLRAEEVDLVLNIGQKPLAYRIVDLLDAPCIANFCAGSDLLHHPKVDLQYHGQPEADYFVMDGGMMCGTTAEPFEDTLVHSIMGYIDPRGLSLDEFRPWTSREPLIVCHGSLFKFANIRLVDALCDVLADDRRFDLILVGKDTAGALASIQQHVARRGLTGQVHYHGQFTAVRNDVGEVNASGWREVVDLLKRARLAPDPFPIGGGSARFEAYALGTPSVHMGVRFDPDAWARPQPGNCEIPGMLIPRATAWSIAEYTDLCRRCLNDPVFADALSQEQMSSARHIADADRFWREILHGYEIWRTARAGARKAA